MKAYGSTGFRPDIADLVDHADRCSLASHFAPRFLMDSIAHYRANFRPSKILQQPYVIAGANVFAAPTRSEAEYIASSHRHWVANLYAGRPGSLPAPAEGFMEKISQRDQQNLAEAMACTVVVRSRRCGQLAA